MPRHPIRRCNISNQTLYIDMRQSKMSVVQNQKRKKILMILMSTITNQTTTVDLILLNNQNSNHKIKILNLIMVKK